MQLNNKMNALYGAAALRRAIESIQLTLTLSELVERGFVEINGCTLLASQIQASSAVSPEDFVDRTGYECFVNHIHLEDYFDDGEITPTATLEQGLAFARELQEKLSQFSSSDRFKVIVSSDDTGCNVRFHKIRNEEQWLAPDIDKYEEALLLLET